MKCSIKRIDLFGNGLLIGQDLPVNWTIEIVRDHSTLNGHSVELRFVEPNAGLAYPASIEPANSPKDKTITTGLRLTGIAGVYIAVLKTDTHIR